jgi:O-methyltransferase
MTNEDTFVKKAKKLIRAFLVLVLDRFGYRIKHHKIVNKKLDDLTDLNQSLMKLRKKTAREVEGLYRDFVFKALPAPDEQRITLMAELLGTELSEAIFILNYLHKSLQSEGDICEFGVAQGATSAFMAYEIRQTDKNFWLFDSFQGLPKPSKNDALIRDEIFNADSIEAYQGSMALPPSMVQKRLQSINFPASRIKVVPGFIEETIKQSHLPAQVCFAYVDFDFYEPISIALDFLDKVLQPGGYVIVDDYNYFSTGVKIAVEEFIATHKNGYTFSLPPAYAGHFCLLEKKK